jgi:hypothetical protein
MRARTLILAAALIAMTGLLPTPVASGQTLKDVAAERDAMTERVVTLETQLAEALAENARLRKQIAMLQAPANTTGPAVIQPASSTDELASPEALFTALRAAYETDLIGTLAAGETMPRVEAVRAWAAEMADSMQGRRRWIARVELMGDGDFRYASRPAKITPLDETRLRPIGPVFEMPLPARTVARVRAAGDDALWIIDATLAATPIVNAERASLGAFDYPRFIGPYAEFAYELNVLSVRKTTEEAIKEKATGIDDGGEGRVR